MRRLFLLISALVLALLFSPATETAPQDRAEVLQIRVNNEAITPRKGLWTWSPKTSTTC